MNVGNLFNQAVNISSAFLRILQEDADLDSSYSLNIAQIEQRYKSKISELDLKRSRRISNASAQDQSAQTNIQDALNALSEAALGRADRIADRDVTDAGQADDVARGGLGDGVLAKALKFVHGDGLGLLRCGVGVVVVADHDLLVLLERAALDAADGHAADILVVVNGGDEHLERRVHIGLRRGDILKDRVKQGL